MKIEDQVCSLELAKKLKELGVKQESLYYYCLFSFFETMEKTYKLLTCEPDCYLSTDINDKPMAIGQGYGSYNADIEEIYSAFTVAELGELLLSDLYIDDFYKSLNLRTEKENNKYIVSYEANYYTILDYSAKDKNEANARANMLIYLLENKLMELPDASI